jgi:hypothetical protein
LASAALFGKIALEGLRLIDMERLEVLVPGIGFEASNGMRHCVNGLFA